MATIDPAAYYDTGTYLADLATRLEQANTDLISGLSGCGGMAGNYDDAKKWAQSYDQSADSVIDNTRTLAETLGHFGSLVSWAGYNHDLANYNSNISTTKGAPPTAPPPVPAPAADACYLDSPGAFGGSGTGLHTDIPNLLEDIGIPVPDGDTTLLDHAAAAWHTFITSEAVEDAMDLSLLGAIRFQHIDSPEVPDIQEHLGTLARCAIDIQDTANRLRQACGDHSTGLTQLRTTLHDLLRDLDIQLGLTIAITIFTSFLSAGTSTGVGTATAATEIATTAARMASAIRDLRIVERITQVFADVKDLSLAKTKNLLSAIRDLRKTSAVEEDIVPAEEAAAAPNLADMPLDESSAAVRDIVTDSDGNLIGTEDAKGVNMVTESQLQDVRADLTARLGPPQVRTTPKGDMEVWMLNQADPRATVTYRTYSESGGPTIDFTRVPGMALKRLHIEGG